jgi:hypothetical protein
MPLYVSAKAQQQPSLQPVEREPPGVRAGEAQSVPAESEAPGAVASCAFTCTQQ